MGVIMHNGVNYTRKSYEPKKPALVSWTTGTNDEITAMVNAYYDGILSLDEIKSVWHLGDTRSVDIAAMEATGVGESHRAQTVEMEILDFDHDTLTTPVGSITKALITVDLKDCLNDGNLSGYKNTEIGYMIETNSFYYWASCNRRQWCNTIFYNSFPYYLQNLIKEVNKLTYNRESSKIDITNDFCFLLSEIEIFGTITYSKGEEGSIYNLFNDPTYIYKLPEWQYPSGGGSFWFTRSPAGNKIFYCCDCTQIGKTGYSSASSAYGIAPACCI